MGEVHGGAAVVAVLRDFGVSQFFNVPGESFLPILDALRAERSIRLITNRHESGAAFGAEGFAKMAGRPAVCMATRGPGASNLTIGIQTAQYDATPMVALLGLIPTSLQGSQAFQEFDSLSMFSSFTKRSLVVASRESLGPTLAQALAEATSGRPGPVVVGIPTDILTAVAPEMATGRLQASAHPTPDIEPLLAQLGQAASPALIMSTAAVRGACAADVATVASRFEMPVFCGWRRFSAFDNGHPAFAGSIGLGSAPSVIARLDAADVAVVFGPLDQVTVDSGRLNRSGLLVVNVAPAPDPFLLRRLPLARVIQVVSAPEIVARLLAEAPGRAAGAAAPARRADADSPETGGQDLTADGAMTRLDRWAPADAVVVSDAGDFAQALLRRFRFDRQRSFIAPLNGAMGYGLPAAIGAQLAEPERPVFCIAGDGGLLMTAGEMETATRLGLDLTVVVFNNGAYGTIRTRQAEAFPGREFGTSLGDVRFNEIAKAMGWRAWPVQTPAELDAALSGAASASGCRLIEVRMQGR
jgi:acetolactate synthase I/II/III large subunit